MREHSVEYQLEKLRQKVIQMFKYNEIRQKIFFNYIKMNFLKRSFIKKKKYYKNKISFRQNHLKKFKLKKKD